MKTFKKYFEGKISYEDIDKFIESIRATLDHDDEISIESNLQKDFQFISLTVLDRVLH